MSTAQQSMAAPSCGSQTACPRDWERVSCVEAAPSTIPKTSYPS